MNFFLIIPCRFIFLFLSLVMGCIQHPPVKELTELENQYLESFFKHLLETTPAGYVLYGEKPLASCHFKSVENTIPGTEEHRNAVLFSQGIHVLKKLNIQSKNYPFVFFINEPDSFQELILINKKAFKEIIRNNLSLFQYKLGPQVNEQNILDSVLSKGLFRGHQALLGILFGFGIENSLTYERLNVLCNKALESSKINPPFQYTNEPKTIEEREKLFISYVNSQGDLGQNLLDEQADFTCGEITPKICFAFHTNSEESKKLLAAYKELEHKMVHLQTQKNFVDQILERLKQ